MPNTTVLNPQVDADLDNAMDVDQGPHVYGKVESSNWNIGSGASSSSSSSSASNSILAKKTVKKGFNKEDPLTAVLRKAKKPGFNGSSADLVPNLNNDNSNLSLDDRKALDTVQSRIVSQKGIRRLARRGGVTRVGKPVYAVMREELAEVVEGVVFDIGVFAAHMAGNSDKKPTIKVETVVKAFAKRGNKILGMGGFG